MGTVLYTYTVCADTSVKNNTGIHDPLFFINDSGAQQQAETYSYLTFFLPSFFLFILFFLTVMSVHNFPPALLSFVLDVEVVTNLATAL